MTDTRSDVLYCSLFRGNAVISKKVGCIHVEDFHDFEHGSDGHFYFAVFEFVVVALCDFEAGSHVFLRKIFLEAFGGEFFKDVLSHNTTNCEWGEPILIIILCFVWYYSQIR